MSDRSKQIVRDVNAAFEAGNTDGFLDHCTEDIKWTMIGEKEANGKQSIREWMGSMEGCEPPKLTTDELVAEGDTVICTGSMTMKEQDGSSGEYGYCDIYRFDGDKISELKSMIVRTNPASTTASA